MSVECVLWLLACCALLSAKINYLFKLSIVRTYSFCSNLVVFSLRSNGLAKSLLGPPLLTNKSACSFYLKDRGFSGSSSAQPVAQHSRDSPPKNYPPKGNFLEPVAG